MFSCQPLPHLSVQTARCWASHSSCVKKIFRGAVWGVGRPVEQPAVLSDRQVLLKAECPSETNSAGPERGNLPSLNNCMG